MTNEILAAAALSGVAVTSLIYAFSQIFKRDIDVSRFAATFYDPSKDDELNQARKEEKRKNRGITISPSKTLLFSVIGMVTWAFLAYVVVGSLTISLIVSLVGLLTPKLWIKWHIKGQEKLLVSQLEQSMEIMSTVLNSGGGIPAALEKAASSIAEPLKTELAQTVAEIKLGVSTADAFKNFSERVKLEETSIIAMAVELKQSGMAVNLAAVFEQVEDNIRARRIFEQEVNAITAENRAAGWIVAVIPFVTVAFIRKMAPDFIMPLFTEPVGITVFSTCVLAIFMGILWIMKMADVSKFS